MSSFRCLYSRARRVIGNRGGSAPPTESESGTISTDGYEVDTSHDRETVYARVVESLAEHTDNGMNVQPLSEKAEILLGLRPYPEKS